MKSLLIIMSVVFGSLTYAQTNTSCMFAKNACGSKLNDTYNVPGCGSQVKLYYYVMAKTTGTFALASVVTSATATVNVYGNFNSLAEGCEQFNQLITPLYTGTGTSLSFSAPTVQGKYLLIEVITSNCSGTVAVSSETRAVTCDPVPCPDCMPSFELPIAKYVISAWVKEGSAPLTTTTYANAKLSVTHSGSTTNTFTPSGQIIDGWQRIEGIFNVTTNGAFNVKLINTTGTTECFFDDIRIFPFDGSMMSYVYDPVTLRLVAELDERNYAKIYEYDEEGKLIRVKKETEDGISTLQESRNNNAGNE